MNRSRALRTDDRGAVLVHVAVALLMLIAISAFAIDFGLFWLSRAEAQNAADSGAMAGAVALAFDNATDKTDSGPAKQSALITVLKNFVWGEAPAVDVATDITFPPCPDGSPSCVRVDVYRDGAHGNPLPMFAGGLVGLSSQGIRATATAEALAGNATDCLKPWALIDRWQEFWPAPGPWTVDSTFDKYKNNGELDPKVTTPDVYTPPTTTSTGSGFAPLDSSGNYTADYGLQLTLKTGAANLFNAGSFQALDLNCPGGACYEDAIKSCVNVTELIGGRVTLETGNITGKTKQGTYTDSDSLCKQDPTAYWDSSLNGGHGGVAGSKFGISPRLVAVPLISPDDLALAKNGKATDVPIENIMGLFIECPPVVNPPADTVVGRLALAPGEKVAGGGNVGSPSSFLKVIALVR
jgi:putative Flp pilus-assembly TadE/G-like protein